MWMTTREASSKWDIPLRTVQHLCKEGKIKGTLRYNRSWLIPIETCIPVVRCDHAQLMIPEKYTSISLKPLDPTAFESILDQYPYSLNVSAVDGTMVFANQKFMDGVKNDVQLNSIGVYNILKEPNIDKWGLTEHLKKAFEGHLVTTRMLKFPNKDLVDIRYDKQFTFVNLYNDITSFPVFNQNGTLTYVVTIFVPSEKHLKRSEIMVTKEYIDLHWIEALSISQIAQLVNLSESRLRTLFKKETGFTIHDYYHDVKMKHLCRLLTHPDLSISEVFTQCGVAYNSYYLKLFKSYSGYSPSQYRSLKKIL